MNIKIVKIVVCPVCKINYEVDFTRYINHGRQTTCSRKCSYILRSEKLSVEKEIFSCGNCGKTIERLPSVKKTRSGFYFCDNPCKREATKKGIIPQYPRKKYTIIVTDELMAIRKEAGRKIWIARRKNGTDTWNESQRTKMSEITSRNIENGVFGRISKIEYLVAEEFSTRGVEFIHQWRIRGELGRFNAVCDFYLPVYNCVVEVNGTYWHSDLRFYTHNENLSYSQKRNLEKYKKKLQILQEMKMPIFEIWEYDINENLSKSVDELLESIQQV